ncbi:fibulin-1-like [Gigantopelta aegis]|uniref:fibulin-1-like n=1 Tax=Gigantopelta aegis TaxID=1735272 RepID=UPI001B88D5FE|nr:fibulin-1-like [Gigantopelta aegis]
MGCQQGCKVFEGQPYCFCAIGYELNSDNKTCKDVDECSGDDSVCNHVCRNTNGGFTCSCFEGYKLQPDATSCRACDSTHYGHNCDSVCACDNLDHCDTIRGCICLDGWSGVNCTDDVNECSDPRQRPCSQEHEDCHNTIGSYLCRCEVGYQRVNETCTNINECLTSSNNCSNNTECIDTDGGFLCRCRRGYTEHDSVCEDIDECMLGIHGCQQNCTNYEGGYSCDCDVGFRLKHDRKTCERVPEDDPCVGSNTTCSDPAYCTAVGGQLTCKCPSGYRLNPNQTSCYAPDPCVSNPCKGPPYSFACDSKSATFTCSCNHGYKLQNDMVTCAACDKFHWGANCSVPCNCQNGATCHHKDGCQCTSDWKGDTCDEDVDECRDRLTCPNASCNNTRGSFYCYCKKGFVYTNNTCQDVDECSEKTHSCDVTQLCSNSLGSYACSCRTGWVHVNRTCIKQAPTETTTTRVTELSVSVEITLSADYKADFSDPDSSDYQEFVLQFQRAMEAKLQVLLTHFIRLIVTKISRGSTVVDFDVYSDGSASVTSRERQIALALSSIYSTGSLLLGNETVNITKQPTIISDGKTENVVCLLCDIDEECIETDKNNFQCRQKESDTSLLMGLAIGIPVSIAVAAIVAMLIVCARRKKTYQKHLLTDDDPSRDPTHVRQAFGSISTAFSGGSYENSFGKRLGRYNWETFGEFNVFPRVQPTEQAAQYDNTVPVTWGSSLWQNGSQEAGNEVKGSPGKFSLDFVANNLDSDREFKIQRPRLLSEPNIVFETSKSPDDFSV